MEERERKKDTQESFGSFCGRKCGRKLIDVDRQEKDTEEEKQKECSGNVAGKNEILRFWTELMQDEEAADIKTRMRAAELLGKQAGLFDKEAEEKERCSVVILDDIA